MQIFDNKGMLIIPNPEKIKTHGEKKGVVLTADRLRIEQAYCPAGHPLVSKDGPFFDGYPGIHLVCEGEFIRQAVYLSPFQGDARKQVVKEFEDGEILKVFCPHCEMEFPKLAPHICRPGAMYITLYLDEDANPNNTVCICNTWNCYANYLQLYGSVLSEVQYQFMLR